METFQKEIICLGCPTGCHLDVSRRGDEVRVDGAQCERGEEYGREEILAPKRMVTAVVRTNSAAIPYMPVRTARPLPKPLIPELLHELYNREAVLPITSGQPLIKDFRGTGVDVVFTRCATD